MAGGEVVDTGVAKGALWGLSLDKASSPCPGLLGGVFSLPI